MTQPSIERLPVVLRRLAISRSTLYKLIQQGQFKPPMQLGPRAVGWLSTDTDEFIATRLVASRRGSEA